MTSRIMAMGDSFQIYGFSIFDLQIDWSMSSSIDSQIAYCTSVDSNVSSQRIVHARAVLERHEDDVRRDGRAAEDIHADGVGDRVHHGAVPRADRRLADALGADRRAGIGNADR